MLDIRTRVRKDARERDGLAYRAARITETELSDVEGAISRYQGILAATPDHPGTREALSAIARGDDTACRPSRCWNQSCAWAAWSEVIELLELRLADLDAVDRRLELLEEIRRIRGRNEPARASKPPSGPGRAR